MNEYATISVLPQYAERLRRISFVTGLTMRSIVESFIDSLDTEIGPLIGQAVSEKKRICFDCDIYCGIDRTISGSRITSMSEDDEQVEKETMKEVRERLRHD